MPLPPPNVLDRSLVFLIGLAAGLANTMLIAAAARARGDCTRWVRGGAACGAACAFTGGLAATWQGAHAGLTWTYGCVAVIGGTVLFCRTLLRLWRDPATDPVRAVPTEHR